MDLRPNKGLQRTSAKHLLRKPASATRWPLKPTVRRDNAEASKDYKVTDPFPVEETVSAEENKRNQEPLAELGLAVFVAQGIEHSVASLIAAAAIRDNRDIPGEEIRSLMDTRYRRTLGRLIKEATEGIDLSEEAIRFLEIALPARNWLAHHFYRQYAGAAFSPRMSREALTLVRHARELFEATMDELGRETTRILGEAGISEEQAAEGAQAAMRQALGTDLEPPII